MTESQHFRDVRASYDSLAVDYGAMYGPTMVEPPIDQLMLKTFAEIVLAGPGGRVLDIGSGPGRISHNLDALGVDVFGLDLSPGMVAVARAAYPGLSFDVGSMLALDLPDAGLAGIVAWWSIIHTPPELLPTVFAEFERTLAPGGTLLVGFHMGDGLRHIDHAYGHDLSLDMWRHRPEQIVHLATDAGLVTYAQLLREPQGRERSVQAMLLFTKPDPAQAETDGMSESE